MIALRRSQCGKTLISPDDLWITDLSSEFSGGGVKKSRRDQNSATGN